MQSPTSIAERSTLLDWASRPFSRVRQGEGLVAALLLACVFLILTSYCLLETAREGMIAIWLAIAYGISSRYRKLSPETAT
jgi:hypothetical protein